MRTAAGGLIKEHSKMAGEIIARRAVKFLQPFKDIFFIT
jgi:hypothetical protein